MADADGTDRVIAASRVGTRDGGRVLLSRLGAMALELAVLGAVWWLLRIQTDFMLGLVVIVVAHNIVPERYSSTAMGVSLLGFAGYLAWRYGWWRIPAVLGLLGLIALAAGVVTLRRGSRPG